MNGIQKFFEYDTLREEGGKVFLHDAKKLSALSLQVDNFAALIKEARQILEKYDYPDNKEWQEAILWGGEEGLKNAILSESDNQARRLALPRFLAVQWRAKALADAPAEMFEEANNLYTRIETAGDGLNIRPQDLKYSKGGFPTINAEEIKKRLALACSLEVTPQMQEEADKIKALIPQLRELNEAGVDIEKVVAAFLGNRYAPSMYPPLENQKILETIRRTRKKTKQQLYNDNREGYYLSGGERV